MNKMKESLHNYQVKIMNYPLNKRRMALFRELQVSHYQMRVDKL